MNKVFCPDCKSQIPAANMDLPTARAKCHECGALFSLSAHLGESPRVKPEQPKSIEVVTDFSDTITYVRRWYSPAAFGLLFFAVLWDGFMIVWFSIAISKGEWGMAAFGTIHALVGIVLLYATLAGFMNRSYLRVSPDSVIVEQKPFPMMRRKEIPVSEIRQIFVKLKISQGKNGTSRSYGLWYLDHENKTRRLAMINSPEEGWFLEIELEKILGIADRKHAEEFRGE